MLSLFNVQEAVMPSDINPIAMNTHEYKYHKPFLYLKLFFTKCQNQLYYLEIRGRLKKSMLVKAAKDSNMLL